MSRRRDRARKPARRQPFRERLPLILVFCEGITEEEYIEGFGVAARNQRIRVEISEKRGVPQTLVRNASQMKRDFERAAENEGDVNIAFDQVWCVFDIDDHPDVPNAIVMARDNGIEVAVSNPCFELWLLIHFRESPGPQDRHKLRSFLREHVPEYDKHAHFEDYKPGYANAVRRAGKMEELAAEIGEVGCNPTTGVYRLTELIRTHGLDAISDAPIPSDSELVDEDDE